MDDLKQLMQQNYLKYASYVILDRAIPDVVDGLKPVQRRILHTLYRLHDGKMHKVANVAGQTMAYHPHGDAPIVDALVNLANKGFLLQTQGNFGNLYTGDPAAAARYIETRLSPLAEETLFNPELTDFIPSYDGRNKEPVSFPAKIPLLLMQGASGIAVGMSTYVLPHNFVELLEAEIAILEGKEFCIFPDFPTGGIMDPSDYDKGRGKIKLRAKVEVRDPKTLVITQICHGTTTESLIRSIDEAAKRGKIRIDSINDYTADQVEIEIKMPRGYYAKDLIESLFAYTDCEVSINSQIVVIKDDLPTQMTVDEILHHHVNVLKGYLKAELELEQRRLLEKIFAKSLEEIFIENRLYKKIENLPSVEMIHSTVASSLSSFHHQLLRVPNQDDIDKLLSIPIRRISRFDLDKNREEINELKELLTKVEKDLKNIKKYTINYLKRLVKTYGKNFARRTTIEQFQEIDKRAIATKALKVGYDLSTGFVGTNVVGQAQIECTNYDKVLILYDDGTYRVMNIPEKLYLHTNGNKAVYVGLADKTTVFSVAYKNPQTHHGFAKRFIVKQFILDKEYRYFDPGMQLQYFTTEPEAIIELRFIPKIKQKISKSTFAFKDVMLKGVSAKGIRMSLRGIKKIKGV